MASTIWTPTLAWLAAASGALLLAFATPSESNVMGRLPSPAAKRLEQRLFSEWPNGRTLVLVGFNREQRVELHSWIDGLGLREETPIAWVKMPVLNDPGNDDARTEIESRLLAGHAQKPNAAPLIPVFANQEEFTRAAGLSGADHASVLVLHRDGRVLARAQGHYDAAKAEALRQTLAGRGD